MPPSQGMFVVSGRSPSFLGIVSSGGGKHSDPLIGRDVLYGAVVAVFLSLFFCTRKSTGVDSANNVSQSRYSYEIVTLSPSCREL